MELQQEWSKALTATTSRNLSSSSSAFFSANQSPFFSPKSPTFEGSEFTRPENPNPSNENVDPAGGRPETPSDVGFVSANVSLSPISDHSNFRNSELHEHVSVSLANHNKNSPSYSHASGTGQKERHRKTGGRSHGSSHLLGLWLHIHRVD
ncbi:hypothetical protein ACHQM5_000526 [Ranunculus cassubicifolius]